MKSFHRIHCLIAALVLVVGVGLSQDARAQLVVDVVSGQNDPLPIAVTDFIGADVDAEIGANISEVVAADLERSGLFDPINRAAFIQSAADIGLFPRFGDWRTINAQALVTGLVEREADDLGFGEGLNEMDLAARHRHLHLFEVAAMGPSRGVLQHDGVGAAAA